MQSVTECIMLGVPMLSYPLLNRKFDQSGNSARIKFHKIGLNGDITKDTESLIHSKIDEILNSNSFKIKINIMRRKLESCSNFEEGIKFIESILKNNTSTGSFDNSI